MNGPRSIRGGSLRRAVIRVPLSLTEAGVITLPTEAATYVTRVHRLGPGARFIAFDPERALEADAELIEATRAGTIARIEALRPASVKPERRVTLIQSTSKGEKMDAIVRDATELGATRIAPVIAERSIARPDAARTERWRRIAVEAARQCGRGDAPTIDVPAKLNVALPRLTPQEGEGAFCLDPYADASFSVAFAALPPGAAISLLVGPEGGLEDAELTAAEQAGYRRVSLGALILRTETVGTAVLGALLINAPTTKR